MKELIRECLTHSIIGSEHNWSDSLGGRYFDELLVKFAAGNDPLFE